MPQEKPTLPKKNQLVCSLVAIKAEDSESYRASGCYLTWNNEQAKYAPIVSGPKKEGCLARCLQVVITSAVLTDPSITRIKVLLPKGTLKSKEILEVLDRLEEFQIEKLMLKKNSPEFHAISEVLDRHQRQFE